MSYDEKLADRIRAELRHRKDVTERRMMGGLTFLCGGRMCGGVLGPDLVARVGRADMPAVLLQPHVRPMDFTGRALTGFVYVAPEGLRRAAALRAWLERGLAVAAAQPSRKTGKSAAGRAPTRRRA
jgi:TfoX/Sxy family transcriptional regulator of competence genes